MIDLYIYLHTVFIITIQAFVGDYWIRGFCSERACSELFSEMGLCCLSCIMSVSCALGVFHSPWTRKTVLPVTRCSLQKNPRPQRTTNGKLLCAEEHERIYSFIFGCLILHRTHTHNPRLFSVESGKPSATQR